MVEKKKVWHTRSPIATGQYLCYHEHGFMADRDVIDIRTYWMHEGKWFSALGRQIPDPQLWTELKPLMEEAKQALA